MTRLITFLAFAAAAHAATINVPADQATVQQGIAAAQPGDTVLVAAGSYVEDIETVRAGTAENRITIDGQNVATVRQINFKHPYVTIQGFAVEGKNVALQAAAWFHVGAHYCILEDCQIDNQLTNDFIGISFKPGPSLPFSVDTASNCQITNNTVRNVAATVMIAVQGADNLVEGNTCVDGAEVDYLRIFGQRNIIRGNTFRNNYLHPSYSNHPDFIQTFGTNGFGAEGIIIEGNVVDGVEGGGLMQLNDMRVAEINDWTFRNNIFINIGNTASINIDGVKIYNNLFYKCSYQSGGHPLTFGRRGYDKADVAPSTPDYALLGPQASGDLVEGGSYIIDLTDPVLSGSIEDGVEYQAVSLSNSSTLTYNGVTYARRDRFFGVSGVTTYTVSGETMKAYRYGTVTYDGEEYESAEEFVATAVLTYTKTISQITVSRRIYSFAHDCEVHNNVFLQCGDARITRGWYSFDQALTGVSADYNYVAKQGFVAVNVDSLQRSIGDPGGWDPNATKWWEDNGINGGDPSFTDFSIYNFALLEGSILIDAGTNKGVTTDINGVVRPEGAGYDIGPYEFDAEGDPPPPPLPNDPPLAPDMLAAGTPSASSIPLTWNDNAADETGFNIARSTDQASWFDLPNAAEDAEAATISGLTASTTYYFRVRAFNASGFSAWSNVSEATTAAPVIQSGDKWVTWDDDTNPAGTINFYNVYLRDVGAGPDFTLHGASTGLTYFFDDLPLGSYEAKAKASRAGVLSADSNTYAFSIGNPPAPVEKRGNPRKGGPMAASIPP